MDAEGNARLAIRTIVVSTRAAVAAHLNVGQEQLSRESAHRGLKLLRELRRHAAAAGAMADYEAAEETIIRMADAPWVAIPVEAGQESASPRTDPRSRAPRRDGR